MGDYMREIEYWHRTWAKNTPKCPGYREMAGKCDDFPIRGSKYCFDCSYRKLEDERARKR